MFLRKFPFLSYSSVLKLSKKFKSNNSDSDCGEPPPICNFKEQPKVCPITYSEDGKIIIRSLLAHDVEPVAQLVAQQFCQDESVCRAIPIHLECKGIAELSKWVCDIVLDGVSIVAVKSDRVVGAAVNKLIRRRKKDEYYRGLCLASKTEAVKRYCGFMSELCCGHAKAEGFYVMHTVFLIVDRKYRRQCIGNNLVRACCEMVRMVKDGKTVKIPITKEDLDPALPGSATFGFTCHKGQRIGITLDLIVLNRVSYDSYTTANQTFTDILSDVKVNCASLEMGRLHV